MANDNTLNVEIKAVITDLERNLKKATRGLDKFSDKAKVVGKKMQTVGIGMSKAFTVPLAILGGVALKAAADLETLETSLSVMTGSAEKGKAIMKDLAEFTAKTPFQLEGVGNTAKQLLAFGFTTEEVKTNLQFLGDAAAGSGNDLGSLGQIFGQISAAGKLTGERLNQLQERAVPIGSALAKSMGVAESSIKEMVSKGMISFTDFEKAFRSLSIEGGIFEGAMIKQSKTLAGIFSTLRDNVQLALGGLGQEIATAFDLKKITSSLIAGIQKVTKWFAELDKSTKKTIIVVVGLVAAAGPLLTILGLFVSTVLPGLVTAFGLLISPIGLIVAGLVAVGVVIYKNWKPIKQVLVNIANYFIDLYNESTIFRIAIESITLVFKNMWATAKFVFKALWSLVKGVGGFIATQFEFIGKIIKSALTFDIAGIKEALLGLGTNTKKTFSDLVGNLKSDFKGLTTDVGDNIKTALENVTQRTKIKILPENVDTTEAEKKVSNISTGGGVGGNFKAVTSQLQAFKAGIVPIVNEINQAIVNTIPSNQQITEKAVEMQSALMEFNAQANDIIQNGIANTFAGIGDAIGGALVNGGNVLKAAGSALLQGIGQIAVRLGESAIGIGVAMLAIKLAFKNPFTAIAAGVALVALGSALGSIASNAVNGGSSSGSLGGNYTASSSGGSRSSGSSTNVGSSGGSSGGTYVFEIAGTKLIGVLKNTLDRNRALGGSDNLLFT